MAAPTFGSLLQVSAAGHTIDANGLSLAPGGRCVRLGEDLFFKYRRDSDLTVWARRYSRTTGLFDPAVQIYDIAGDPGTQGSHEAPLLTRLASGMLLSLWTEYGANVATGTIPPLHRILPKLADPATWTEERGLHSRDSFVGWTNHAVATQYDLRAVFEPVSGVVHVAAEGGNLGPLDGTPYVAGLPASYYRFTREGVADGPYIIVRAGVGFPVGADVPGQIFTKGAILLGRERERQRSLYWIWNVRNTFQHPTGTDRQHQYDLYCAKSVDGGNTWRNLAGTKLRTKFQGIEWNDVDYRAWTGDGGLQGYEFAVDIDPETGWPEFCFFRAQTGDVVLGRRDIVSTSNDPNGQWKLYHARRIGSSWVETQILPNVFLSGVQPTAGELNFFISGDGTRFVAVENGGTTPSYSYSTNKGLTWPALAGIPGILTDGRQLRIDRSPFYPEWCMLTWGNAVDSRMDGMQVTFGSGPAADHPPTLQTVLQGAPWAPVSARAEGDEFPNDGTVVLYLLNESTESKTVTMRKQRAALDPDGSLLHRQTVVPPLQLALADPCHPAWFNNVRGNVEITYSPDAIGLRVAAVRMPNALGPR